MIPLSVPNVGGNAAAYVQSCLDSGWVSSAGAFVERFEREFAAYTNARHAVACVNGTAALQLALQLAGVRPGELVLVPTLTFIATVNAVHYLGAEPVFLDSDDSYCVDPDAVLTFLAERTERRDDGTYERASGRRVAATLPVHVFGNAARLEPLVAPLREARIALVEDAAESLGTVYTDGTLAGRHTGTIGALGCFSFNGNKIITTGGGGMIITDDDALARQARYLSTQAKDDEVRYVHHEVGFNFRLTNLQAALGVAQLEMLPAFLETKRANFLRYREVIRDIEGLELADAPTFASNNHWMYALQIDALAYGCDREQVMIELAEAGIQTRPVWELNHRQRPYALCRHERVDNALRLHERTLNLPCSTNLTSQQVDAVCERLHRG